MRIRRVLFATFLVMATTAGAGSPGRCRPYAQSAVADYKQMKSASKKCQVKDDARWHDNYDNHYGWCLKAPNAWITSESKARNSHLLGCGARSNY
jgi:hypothetical protein